MRRAALSAFFVTCAPRLALACPVCFGVSDGPMLQGSNMGILALLLVTLTMLGVFGAFFYTLSRRASNAQDTAGESGLSSSGASGARS